MDTIVEKLVEYTFEPIWRQLGYLYYYNSNVANIEEQVGNLGDERSRVQHSVDEAKRNGEEIEDGVKKWLGRVDEIIVETKKLFQPKISCLNLKSWYQLSRKAKKMAVVVVDEIEKAGKFVRVSYKLAPSGIATIASTRDYESLESRKSTFHEIIGALRNDGINMIGVYGMGGVGKTTLVKEVARQAQEGKLFDTVIMVIVTHNPNLKEIQEEIAYGLGLKFDEQSVACRASRLLKRIKQEEKEKILIILDDLWVELDLDKVGVPFGNDCKGCNILLTSRNLDVLHNQMGCQLNFSVGTLPEEEAWRLFKKMAGDCVENSNLQSTAVEVSKKCSGLPVAIVTVARALRDKSPYEWKNALRQLQRPNVRNVGKIPKDVYSALQLSYDYLNSQELKLIFLLCGLIANNATIMDLLKYSFGLGILEGVYTMEEAQDRVHTLVQQLKASCLLLESGFREQFMMHDVVRDVAISIASRDQYVFTVQNDEVKEWPDKDQLKNYTKIFLCYSVSDMNGLPERLECPNLEFFYMVNKDSSIKVPDSFFERLCSLKVLNFASMHFPSLPSSLNLLTNLQALCLDQCELEDNIDLIGELKNLKILSLINSNIKQLPGVIGQLTHMKLLDLRGCSELKVIPPNIISSLKELEELYVGDTFHEWEVEGLKNASLSELKHLCNLTALDIRVWDATVLPKDLYFEKLERYRISIGNDWKWYGNEETSRILKLKFNIDYHSQYGVKMLLNNVENLDLGELKGVNNVLYELNSEGFPLLKHLHVQKNDEIQHIVNSMDWSVNRPCSAFVILESLSLSYLSNLEDICHGPLTGTSFCKLRSIQVNDCDKLKNLFSASIAKGLLELQEIRVRYCEIMEEIVVEGEEEDANNSETIQNIEFRQLRNLSLIRLPKLVGFYSRVKSSFVSQKRDEKQLIADTSPKEIISEDELGTPMYLFNKKVALPNLENIEISSLDNLRMIWHDKLIRNDSFCKLRSIQVYNCHKLKNLFSVSIAKGLLELQEISVERCQIMEEIVVEGEEEDANNSETIQNIEFRQLHTLKLKYLPKLIGFYSRVKSSFVSQKREKQLIADTRLKEIISVDELGTPMYLFNQKVALPDLENMKIKSMDNLRMIWHDQLVLNDSFCKLKILKVKSCYSLKSLFPTSVAKHLVQLEKLWISDCNALEDIVIKQEGLETEPIKFVFPKLTSLTLGNLPELKSFYLAKYTLECPSLKVLEIHNCNKVKILFASDLTISLPDITIQQPLFWIKKVALPNLKNMEIYSMDNLRMIWHNQLVLNDSFCKLKILKVWYCGSLKSLFPTFVAKHLIQLEKLEIFHCKALEDIVVKEDGLGTEPNKFVFPKLTFLKLFHLPELKSFYPTKYTLECPSLKELEIIECNKVKILFASDLTISFPDITIQQPLFWIKKDTFANLEELKRLEWNDAMNETWHGQFPAEFFPKLKVFYLHFSYSESTVFAASFVQELYNLQKLQLRGDLIEEIRPYEGSFPISLRNLKLHHMPKLVHLCKEDSQTGKAFQNLETLYIDECDGLINLVTSSTAKTLVQLWEIRIWNCNNITEIVAKEGGEAGDPEIVFGQLKFLLFRNLPRLTSFHPGNCTMKFPSLEVVEVESCPELKFSLKES